MQLRVSQKIGKCTYCGKNALTDIEEIESFIISDKYVCDTCFKNLMRGLMNAREDLVIEILEEFYRTPFVKDKISDVAQRFDPAFVSLKNEVEELTERVEELEEYEDKCMELENELEEAEAKLAEYETGEDD